MVTILIGGGTGLIGQRLCDLLTERKHNVRLLSRAPKPNNTYPTFKWNPIAGQIDGKALEGVDVIINLAGAGIADRAWTAKRKKLIIDSRVKSNELLADTLLAKNQKVKAFISASAVGYYGDREDEKLTESSAPGNDGFLSESCMQWEASTEKAVAICDRLAIVRIGVVFSVNGGALEKMLLPFNFGMGNYFGDGTAYMPWVHIDDISRLFIKVVEDDKMEGVFNGVAPEEATGKEVAVAIKKAKGSFALIMPVPAFALKIGMGERVTMLTDSTRVVPQKTLAAGFKFQYPELLPALKDILTAKK
ncbi:MAG: hypothetical protein ACI956_001968 [Nonlabens sp.]|jgi:uncharacterized protein (TIGR01777 family)